MRLVQVFEFEMDQDGASDMLPFPIRDQLQLVSNTSIGLKSQVIIIPETIQKQTRLVHHVVPLLICG